MKIQDARNILKAAESPIGHESRMGQAWDSFADQTKKLHDFKQEESKSNKDGVSQKIERRSLDAKGNRVDRRKDSPYRQLVNEMSTEDMRQALLTDDLTGMDNARGFWESFVEAGSTHVARLDMDNLHDLNEILGYDGSNQLIKIIAETSKKLGIYVAREKGDEFLSHGTEAELRKNMESLTSALESTILEVRAENGKLYEKTGVFVSYGIEKTLGRAEGEQKLAKARRTAEGKRINGRQDGAGSQLPGLGEITSEGRESEGRKVDDKIVPAPEKGLILKEGGIKYEIQREGSPGTAEDGDSGGDGQLSLFTNAEEKGPQKKFIESYPAKIGTFLYDAETVSSAEDAARLLSPISANAQEVAAVVVLDQNGKPLAVLKHSTGTPTANQLAPGHLIGSILNVKGASSFWFAHNHPTGRTIASDEDVKMTARLMNGTRGVGISFAGHVILTPVGEAAELDQQGNVLRSFRFSPPANAQSKVKVTERSLRGDTSELLSETPVADDISAKDAMEAYSHGMSGILFLDAGNRPVRFLPVSSLEMESLRKGEKKGMASQIYTLIDKVNTVRNAIIRINNRSKIETAVKNLNAFLLQAGVNPLDIYWQGHMMSGSGVLPLLREDAAKNNYAFYSRNNQSTTTTTTPAEVKAEIIAQHGAVVQKRLDAGDLVVLPNSEGLPAGTLKSGVKGMYLGKNDTMYLVANQLEQGKAGDTLYHEALHRAMSTGKFAPVLAELRAMKESGVHPEWFAKAEEAAQVDKDSENYIEEIAGYATEQYEEAPKGIRAWVDKMIAKAKAILMKTFGLRVGKLNPAMLRAIAAQGLRMKSMPGEGGSKYSQMAKEYGITVEEAKRQYEAVEKQYKGTSQWMKAPNGEATKLNERQWVQTRTEAFKEWFGDWEQAAGVAEADIEFSSSLAKWESLPRNESVELSYTPKVFQMLGAYSLPLQIDKATIRKVLLPDSSGGKHGRITLSQLQSLPSYLSRPIAVFESKSHGNSFVVMMEMKDKDGDTVVAAIHIEKQKGKNVVNDIASVYGKDSNEFFVNEAKAGRIRYLDENKSRDWSQSSGLYLPTESDLIAASKSKVLTERDVVKDESVSKVVDANGEPMVVYHNTNSEFTEFKPGEKDGLSGKGIYSNRENLVLRARSETIGSASV